jgi:hypothetical protein
MADPLHPIPTVIPMCDAGGTNAPCWSITAPTGMQAAQCSGQVVAINDGGTMPANNTKSDVNCSLCVPGFADPATGCP